ncbi:oxidoreductase [Haladaptatus caseinilyticus]|uniref:oxidoreductase n=1 Tax=Haladaptatus caseinilyticus TaxID=2993314 RepID=UPI00224A5789|nr:oxidoreductase [Haladaptatus caseinilyticus]
MANPERWTTERLPDLTDKTVIVTGANSGLGYEVTRALARNGASVVMACRRTNHAMTVKGRILTELPDATLDVRELDLADSESIRSFVDDFESEYDDLHVLCNNAGVMAIPRTETEDGFELQFGVNHLGHFALTGLLFDSLLETPGETRVVTQSSGFHERGDIDFDDLHGEQEYDKWAAYAQSKLANVLFAYELDRRLTDSGTEDVLSLACHPGYASTDLQRRGPEREGSLIRLWAMGLANAVFAQSAERGALPMLYAATADELIGGEYVGPSGLMNMRGSPDVQPSSERSYDEKLARRLWDVSEGLTGVTYGFPQSKATTE